MNKEPVCFNCGEPCGLQMVCRDCFEKMRCGILNPKLSEYKGFGKPKRDWLRIFNTITLAICFYLLFAIVLSMVTDFFVRRFA